MAIHVQFLVFVPRKYLPIEFERMLWYKATACPVAIVVAVHDDKDDLDNLLQVPGHGQVVDNEMFQRVFSVQMFQDGQMDLAMLAQRLLMVVDHFHLNRGCMDDPGAQLSLVFAILHVDFETIPVTKKNSLLFIN